MTFANRFGVLLAIVCASISVEAVVHAQIGAPNVLVAIDTELEPELLVELEERTGHPWVLVRPRSSPPASFPPVTELPAYAAFAEADFPRCVESLRDRSEVQSALAAHDRPAAASRLILLAVCQLRTGDVAAAVTTLEEIVARGLDSVPTPEVRAPDIQDLLEAARAAARPFHDLTVASRGWFSIDGGARTECRATPCVLRLREGAHTIVLERLGRSPLRHEIWARERPAELSVSQEVASPDVFSAQLADPELRGSGEEVTQAAREVFHADAVVVSFRSADENVALGNASSDAAPIERRSAVSASVALRELAEALFVQPRELAEEPALWVTVAIGVVAVGVAVGLAVGLGQRGEVVHVLRF